MPNHETAVRPGEPPSVRSGAARRPEPPAQAFDARDALVARGRAGLLLTILACGIFAAADVWIAPEPIRGELVLMRGALAAIALPLLVALSRPAGRRAAVPILLASVAATALLTAWSGALSSQTRATSMVLLILAVTTATALPWGLGPQLVTVAVIVSAVVLHSWIATGSLALLAEYPSVGLAVGLVVSAWMAYELERARVAQARAEAAVRQSEEKFRTIAQRILEPVSLSRLADGAYLEVNDAWLELTGLTRERVLGRRLEELPLGLTPDSVARYRDLVRERGVVSELEIELRTAAGETRTVLFSSVGLTVAGESCALTVAHDISRRKAIETMRADLVAMLTHDIKNPLAVIEGFVELLLDGEPQMSGEERRSALMHIGGSARKAMMLATNFLDAARIQSEALVLRKAAVDVGELLRHAARHQSRLAEMRRVKLVQDVGDGLLLTADTPLLDRVFTNLIHNAIQHSPRGGTVLVAASREDGAVEVRVEDTGPGIADEDLPRLFQRYAVGAKRSDSSGLGLFIVKTITEAHGGEVVAENLDGRPGARFRVRLPLDGTADVPSDTAETTASVPGRAEAERKEIR